MIVYERCESFAIVRLNRPDKLNALSRDMLETLGETITNAQDNPDLRAIILTGTGRAFSAGTDLHELAKTKNPRELSERGQSTCNLIERCEVPVIAAINGIAAGGGCELALACHIRLASHEASFSLPETKLGIIPGYGGTQRLSKEVGRGKALEMMLTGAVINAEEALRIGLINRLMPAQDLMPQAESLAREIAQLAPLAIRACLRAVTRGGELPLAEGLAPETSAAKSICKVHSRALRLEPIKQTPVKSD